MRTKTLNVTPTRKFAREFLGAPTVTAKAVADELRRLANEIELNAGIDTLRRQRPRMQPAIDVLDVRMTAIIDAVCAQYWIDPARLRSKTRTYHIAAARQVAFYMCRTLTDLSFPEIGDYFNRDHSTVIHGCDNVVKRMKAQPEFAKSVQRLMDSVGDFGALTACGVMLTNNATAQVAA